MEAKSWGLEILARVGKEEVKKLQSSSLTGKMNYKDENLSRDIEVEIVLENSQRELLAVTQEPLECYFGLSSRVTFSINSIFYDSLVNEGYSGSRFYGAVGKLEVEVLSR